MKLKMEVTFDVLDGYEPKGGRSIEEEAPLLVFDIFKGIQNWYEVSHVLDIVSARAWKVSDDYKWDSEEFSEVD